MKKFIKKLSVATGTILGTASVAMAQVQTPAIPQTSTANILVVAQRVINAFLLIAGVIAIGYLVWSGIRYITSAGDEKAVEAAKNGITYAVIGIIVIIIAYTLTAWVIGRFAGI